MNAQQRKYLNERLNSIMRAKMARVSEMLYKLEPEEIKQARKLVQHFDRKKRMKDLRMCSSIRKRANKLRVSIMMESDQKKVLRQIENFEK